MAQHRNESAAAAVFVFMPPKTGSSIDGLLGRPELNGRVGRVLVWNARAGRAGVEIDGLPKKLAVNPANLVLLPPEQTPGGAEEAPS